MTRQEIFQKVKTLIIDSTGMPVNEITEESNFDLDLNMDVIDMVGLIIDIEDEFDITVPDEVDNFKKVSNIVDYIIKNQGE